MLAIVIAFAMHSPIPCGAAQTASHCPMHSTTAPCCRIAGCLSSFNARHEAASLEASASIPLPVLAFFSIDRDCHLDEFIRAVAGNASLPYVVSRSLEFRPLLI
jgi:hypothetical protein